MYGHVIHINQYPSFSHFLLKDSIHHGLKGGGGICESEEHYCGFEQPFRGEECPFPFISLFDLNIVVAPSDI